MAQRPSDLLYAVGERPPPGVLALSAVQHVALVTTTLVYPLILGREAGLTGSTMLDLVSLSMLALGASSILFCLAAPRLGSGYLVPASFTAIYLGPSLFALRQGGLALAFGMSIAAGAMQLAIAPVLHRLRALLPPEIAGLVIAVVGLSTAALGVRYGLGLHHAPTVDVANASVAGLSLLVMVALNVWMPGYGRMFCVLAGMAAGYGASAARGTLDLTLPDTVATGVLRVPDVDHLAWSFDLLLALPFAVVALACTVRLMGDISNAQRINDVEWVRPNFRSLAGGVAANGLAQMFCGFIGAFGINSHSSSVGLSGATGVTSRAIGYVVGALFVVLAFFPRIAALLAAMPAPVMGAALFFTAAFVLTSGLQMITARMLDARKTLVIGFSFAMAVAADLYQPALSAVPVWAQPIVGNALVLGTLCAVVLNLLMRVGVRQKVALVLDGPAGSADRVEQFLKENGARWAARRDVIDRAVFGTVQLLEIIADRPGPTEIDASFDEFSLVVRVRHAGAPIALPESRPTPREIVMNENGETLLAGYLLRRSADRVVARGTAGIAEALLHFDH